MDLVTGRNMMQLLRFVAQGVILEIGMSLLNRVGNRSVDKSVDSVVKKLDVSRRNYGGELKYADYKELPKLDIRTLRA